MAERSAVMDGRGVFSGFRVALPEASDLDAAARLIRQENGDPMRFSLEPAGAVGKPLESWIVDLYERAFDDVVLFTA
jgi:hypothetical protein